MSDMLNATQPPSALVSEFENTLLENVMDDDDTVDVEYSAIDPPFDVETLFVNSLFSTTVVWKCEVPKEVIWILRLQTRSRDQNVYGQT